MPSRDADAQPEPGAGGEEVVGLSKDLRRPAVTGFQFQRSVTVQLNAGKHLPGEQGRNRNDGGITGRESKVSVNRLVPKTIERCQPHFGRSFSIEVALAQLIEDNPQNFRSSRRWGRREREST